MLNFGISRAELKRIMAIDGAIVSSDPTKYSKANEDHYYVLCNTWLLQCYDLAGSAANRILLNSIKRNGLLATIDTCSNIASELIACDFDCNYVGSEIGPLRALLLEDPRATLQLLRYPKRYSPTAADLIAKESINSFLRVNLKCKGFPSVITESGRVLERDMDYPRWLIDGVRRYVEVLLHDECLEYEQDGVFSNGATADGCKTRLAKVKAYAKYCPYYLSPLYPLSTNSCEDTTCIKLVTVPKSYKRARVIAECSAYRQFHLQGIRRQAERSISTSVYSDLIVLDDQTINQEWARLGSIYDYYATIDLSAASDSISDHLARKLLPRSWYAAIDEWNTNQIQTSKGKVKRYIFQTSGNGSTFVIESVIFLSIALFATEMVTLLTGHVCQWPRVFGDDIITDARCYDTTADFLAMLGFEVNSDKSFGLGSRYRESCGAEYWCGLDTTTMYYPRENLNEGSAEYLEHLTALQHKMFSISPTANEWICRHIRKFATCVGCNDMTSSDPGVETSDLWEDYPYFKVVNPPFDHSRMNEAPEDIRREAHSAMIGTPAGKYDDISSADAQLLEMTLYVDFLRFGPQIDEYGISVPPADRSSYCFKTEQKWTTIKR